MTDTESKNKVLEEVLSKGSSRVNINSSTLTSKAYEYVSARIQNGSMIPGEKIVEAQICKKLKLSTGPIREAMALLEMEGWVKRIKNKGVYVSKVEEKDIENIFDAREKFETMAVKSIAGSISDAQLDQLKHLVEIIEQAREQKPPDMRLIRQIDTHFHRLLVHFMGNPVLDEAFESIISRSTVLLFPWRVEYPNLFSGPNNTYKIADHRDILESLTAHDNHRTERLIQQHIKRSYNITMAVKRFFESIANSDKHDTVKDS